MFLGDLFRVGALRSPGGPWVVVDTGRRACVILSADLLLERES